MPRSGEDARRRLQQAALELYSERGFEETTAAQIAARAGLNPRTFFRHYPDKREVLFDGEADLRAALVREVIEAPEDLAPFEVLLGAFRTAARILEDNRPFSEPRLQIIAATPALRERELAKHASIIEALAQALRRRGQNDRLAALAAQTGWATFQAAADAWIEDPSQSLQAHLDQAFDDLHTLSAATRPRVTCPEN
ncbi:TetR family transcriptional regulator [Actinoallomurus rhizosphaericola]|uniref:TetR family transcriptional regulator n=1 Tax=Actinoallomurus rhizosphaericola TaxID=2952536 RepID=UPI0020929150|nr:TetR family transcriptional regulator [Actinoallomurus rhizosphaericola]MCO5997500.1 TetR/AcrR family transcriptional regulator [Actinoallomurus rhizosphaericola]